MVSADTNNTNIMFEIIENEFCKQLLSYQFHVKIEDNYFPVLKENPSEGEKIIFGNYAILDENGIACLNELMQNSFGLITKQDVKNFGALWTKNYKKLPLTLIQFLAENPREKLRNLDTLAMKREPPYKDGGIVDTNTGEYIPFSEKK